MTIVECVVAESLRWYKILAGLSYFFLNLLCPRTTKTTTDADTTGSERESGTTLARLPSSFILSFM